MRLKNIFILCFLCAVMFACEPDTPPGIIPKDKMEKVLVDIHLANGIYHSKYELKKNYKNFDKDLYFAVLRKYDITDSILVRSIFYYSEQSGELNSIYDNVMNDLKMRNENVVQEIEQMPDSLKKNIDMGLELEGEPNRERLERARR
ncbi:DUF4296 domain-containing protein [Halosquirtibacter laminarini]|uniref:DUF4296 domain-containing protein n=1 Tax=Halosquirtibacter laminarini TaxID=3374600 RepID=A0AC61NPE2_9BACT|nr:DUF4296 domain-containing protein [Prolixibacteraceae bacterium]